MGDLMRYAAYGTENWLGGYANIRPNLRGILALAGVPAQAAVMLTVILSALLFLLIAWRLRNRREPQELFPPLIAFTLAASIYVNAHDLALLLIPVLALLAERRKVTLLTALACFCMPLLRLAGQEPMFFFVMCAVLWVTLQQAGGACAEPLPQSLAAG